MLTRRLRLEKGDIVDTTGADDANQTVEIVHIVHTLDVVHTINNRNLRITGNIWNSGYCTRLVLWY